MNEEEIKAIRSIEKLIKWLEKWNDKYEIVPEDKKYFEIILSLIEKQKAEIEKKDKIINLMAEKLKQLREASLDDCFIPRSYRDIDDCLRTTCEECIKEYFENKVKESK